MKRERHSRNKLKIAIASQKNLKSLYEDCKEIYDEYNNELSIALRHFENLNTKKISQENFDDQPTTLPAVSEKAKTSESHNAQKTEKSDVSENKKADPWVKKLYRAIMMKAHPDKVSQSDFNRKDELQHLIASEEAIAAFQNDDHLELVRIGLDLDIQTDIPYDKIFQEVNASVKSFRNLIMEVEKSVQWLWGESFGDVQKRAQILAALLENFKIKFENREIIREYIIKLEQDDKNPNRKARVKRKVGHKPKKIINRR